jgi:hypothetical protein
VSPAGLHGWRSRSVNAWMMSGASNARFRRPTVTWFRMPASTSRATAWLVWTKLRPIRSVALLTVTTGAPSRARSKQIGGRAIPDLVEAVSPRGFDHLRWALAGGRVRCGACTRACESADPQVGALVGRTRRRRAAVAAGLDPADVILGRVGKDEGYELFDKLRWRRDERCTAWVVVTATDPVPACKAAYNAPKKIWTSRRRPLSAVSNPT